MLGALRTDVTSGVTLVHRKGRHYQQRRIIARVQDTLDYTSGDEARQLAMRPIQSRMWIRVGGHRLPRKAPLHKELFEGRSPAREFANSIIHTAVQSIRTRRKMIS
jgi:hypothetical protein